MQSDRIDHTLIKERRHLLSAHFLVQPVFLKKVTVLILFVHQKMADVMQQRGDHLGWRGLVLPRQQGSLKCMFQLRHGLIIETIPLPLHKLKEHIGHLRCRRALRKVFEQRIIHRYGHGCSTDLPGNGPLLLPPKNAGPSAGHTMKMQRCLHRRTLPARSRSDYCKSSISGVVSRLVEYHPAVFQPQDVLNVHSRESLLCAVCVS